MAVLKKVAHLPWESVPKSKPDESEASRPQPDSEPADAKTEGEAKAISKDSGRRSPFRKKRRIIGYKEDPFFFFEEQEEDWLSIKYGHSSSSNNFGVIRVLSLFFFLNCNFLRK